MYWFITLRRHFAAAYFLLIIASAFMSLIYFMRLFSLDYYLRRYCLRLIFCCWACCYAACRPLPLLHAELRHHTARRFYILRHYAVRRLLATLRRSRRRHIWLIDDYWLYRLRWHFDLRCIFWLYLRHYDFSFMALPILLSPPLRLLSLDNIAVLLRRLILLFTRCAAAAY